MSTALRFTASKGSTSLPRFGRIFPLPWIFTEGIRFSKLMLLAYMPSSALPHLLRIPGLTFTVKFPSKELLVKSFISLPLML